MPLVLVTGGAGYIGSHTVRHLLDAGHEVVVLDDLSTGHRGAIPTDIALEEVSLADLAAVTGVLERRRPDALIHFAGSIEAGESMTDPQRFYRNNVVNSLNLLDAVVAHGAVPVVFSSSAAVYGEPESAALPEHARTEPTNVYGETKLMVERVLRAYDSAYGLRSISLRYFNACGARPDGSIGADHRNKTHLITLAMLAALGRRPDIKVFGDDYPTADGTCIRDYIHVDDLASAHVLALDALAQGAATNVYNVGIGVGHSVREVLDATDRVTGRPLARTPAPRRAGDPSFLVADPTRIRTELGWEPAYTDLDAIIATAWTWHRTHPDGFGD